MQKIQVNASKNYSIFIGSSVLPSLKPQVLSLNLGHKIMLVSDDQVFPLYGKEVTDFLEDAGFAVFSFVFLRGENSKNFITYEQLLSELSRHRFGRNDTVVSLGGGVAGDLAGFAAATFQRGIHLIQMPTSLLAMVDASLGGKNAINLESEKNQVGTFYQPDLVICELNFLKTLPESEYENGCAEIIKYAMISGDDFLEQIQSLPICAQYEEIISKSVSVKKSFIEEDERDRGNRMILNFGHTIGHGIEACGNFSIPHGAAVAMGMSIITKAAAEKGFCNPAVYRDLSDVLSLYGLPEKTLFTREELLPFIAHDKKAEEDFIHLIVPRGLGQMSIEQVKIRDLADWLSLGGLQ